MEGAPETLRFTKGGFYVLIHFFQGKADSITFRKVAENGLGNGEEISPAEQEMLMALNGGSRTWTRATISNSTSLFWKTDDSQLIAAYEKWLHFFTISTKAWSNRSAPNQDKEKGNIPPTDLD